jgi:hypothetical protein
MSCVVQSAEGLPHQTVGYPHRRCGRSGAPTRTTPNRAGRQRAGQGQAATGTVIAMTRSRFAGPAPHPRITRPAHDRDRGAARAESRRLFWRRLRVDVHWTRRSTMGRLPSKAKGPVRCYAGAPALTFRQARSSRSPAVASDWRRVGRRPTDGPAQASALPSRSGANGSIALHDLAA